MVHGCSRWGAISLAWSDFASFSSFEACLRSFSQHTRRNFPEYRQCVCGREGEKVGRRAGKAIGLRRSAHTKTRAPTLLFAWDTTHMKTHTDTRADSPSILDGVGLPLQPKPPTTVHLDATGEGEKRERKHTKTEHETHAGTRGKYKHNTPSRTPGTLRSARRPYRHRSPPLRPTRCPNPRSSSPCTSMHKGLCMERMFHRRGRSLGRSSGEIRRTQDTQRHTSSAHAQHIPNSKRNTRPSRATRRQDTEPAAGKPSPAADELSTAADKLAAALATLSR